ncbi:acyltransferase [Pusillimonas caeni]|uniref:acyltransferase family protein n=1 Tax=Pusillimonas caeni TaxID=1348472 RepID=UPI000E59BBFF|nr:acyltransferase family protein [Pusillimonas caeni]TFL14232.1 acyltransferase [Pusillimonas caeni]
MSAGRTREYRADIDGLRTVAVLSVLLFHIDFSWVPGGYTGVDIFFVISGFLITRIIGREIERGKFSLRWFYVRRIRRILPVFYTVTVVTMLVGAVLLLPKDFHALLSSVRHAALFAANIYFSRDKGYFDISADEKPMLHVWSLSIEEQYYFIWPLLLLLLYAVGHFIFRQRRRLSQPATLVLTLALIVMGFAYAQTALIANPGAAGLYFVLQTRFGELMIGSFVALIPLYRNRVALRALAYAGGILIFLGMATLSKDSLFPGLNALYPCLGAAFLIYSGQERGGLTLLHKALGMPAMAFIGLLSYSLYLWHWPILAYMRYVYGSYALPWHWVLQAIVLTFLLAFLSYWYIERKTKAASLSFRSAFFGAFLTPALLIIAATYGLQQVRPIATLDMELRNYGTDVCHGRFDKQCVRGDRSKSPTVLMTGDSHAAMLNSFIDVVGRYEGWSANVLTGSSCSPVFDFDETVLRSWAHKPCNDLKDLVAKSYGDYEAVFIASLWAFQLGMLEARADGDYLSKLELTLRKMAQKVPVYVFSDPPRLPVHPLRQLHFAELGLSVERQSSNEYARANALVKQLVERIPNAHWVDLSPALAGFEHMSTFAGKPTHFDEHHLNVYGATVLGELFIQSGGRILNHGRSVVQ